ncbi:MAG TPA: preprotein translocase subunit SecE [Candidatus Paceibacterota bacterium]|nr:preprotein translocase subunit SecE [Candidatus Paceibacterota bacterium]
MKVLEYIKGTKEEMKQVKWPTRKEVVVSTLAVILISVGVAYFLWAFDSLFAAGLAKLLAI